MFVSLRTLLYHFTRFYMAANSGCPSARAGWCGGGSAAASGCWAALRHGSVGLSSVFRHCSWGLDVLVCRICSGAVFLRVLKEMGKAASDVMPFNNAIYDGFFI